MDNVPSSVILLAISVVTACLIATLAIGAYHSADNTSKIGVQQNAEIYGNINDEQYKKYDGMEVRGSGVLRAISLLSEEKVSIQVQQRNDTYESFGYFVAGDETLSGNVKKTTKLCELGDKVTDQDARYENAKLSSKGSGTYIEPDRIYVGRTIPNKNGAVIAIAFDTVY